MNPLEQTEVGRVDIWQATLSPSPQRVEELSRLLDEDELERAHRRIIEAKKVQCIVSRGTLRTILSRYVDASATDLRFSYGEHGKPSLVGESISFNVSHSGDVLLIAVTAGDELGIDVERVRTNISHEAIAPRFFSDSEVAALAKIERGARPRAFFRCWTLKEAFVKVKGVGLAMPLHEFDVTVAPDAPVALLGTRPDAKEKERWVLSDVPVESGYLAALAVEKREVEVVPRKLSGKN